jgi:predicted membrane channel-forming protein YqfA (hemolysin III family)
MNRFTILALVTALAIALVAAMPPSRQNPHYHDFADSRPLLGVTNGANVLSNVLLIVAGTMGLALIPRHRQTLLPHERAAFAILFAGLLFTGVGSTCYHLAPDNNRLFWDRFPLAIGVMAFVALIVGWYAGAAVGARALVPLVLAGAASITWWRLTGDLRWWWFTVELYPLLVIALLMLMFRNDRIPKYTLLGAAGLFALAQTFDTLDLATFEATGGTVSGHTLKHIAAAGATCVLIRLMGQPVASS